MTHPSTPRHRRDAGAPAVPASAHAGLVEAADTLGVLAVAADIAQHPDATPAMRERVAALMGHESRRLAGVLRTMAAGVAMAALLAAGLVVAPLGTPRADAAVIWSPPVVQVTLDRPTVRFAVPVMVDRPNTAGVYSASVWLPQGGRLVFAGVASSRTSLALSVPVTVDARTFPVGRSTVWVQDDADGDLRPVVVEALRPSRVLRPFVADAMAGRLYVAGVVQHYSPAVGTWVGSKLSPLRVQVLVGRTWRTVGTITSDSTGHASGFVPVGPGRWLVRLARPQGATVTAAVSAVAVVTVTAQAIDLE